MPFDDINVRNHVYKYVYKLLRVQKYKKTDHGGIYTIECTITIKLVARLSSLQ